MGRPATPSLLTCVLGSYSPERRLLIFLEFLAFLDPSLALLLYLDLNLHAASTSKTGQPLDRAVLESVLRRRLFYTPSFEIYGGERGLFDYGPPGCALQANVVDLWRKHFVLEEDMLVEGADTWEQVAKRLPAFEGQEADPT